ncbi:MAG: CHRD domain-containing protein [Burkholderiales bacterium]
MDAMTRKLTRALWIGAAGAALLLAGCSYVPTVIPGGERVGVKLSGSEEVPPVEVVGTGSGHIAVSKDGEVSGSITTTDVAGVAAHIHIGAKGKNGPVIIPLKKTDPNTWVVPEGAKLTESQLAAYKKGDLYVNVHTARHKGGEVRAQIVP